MLRKKYLAALVVLTGAVFSSNLYSASCCGGGSSSFLLVPKFSKSSIAVGAAMETYQGFWTSTGKHLPDPDDSLLRQFRATLSGAIRLNDNFQLSLSIPYVFNNNLYSGAQYDTNGLGDTYLTLTYEAFDNITCVWKVRDISDLRPAAYFSVNVLIPTGISPYSDVENNFDITGRGFYRVDFRAFIDKTIYPFSMSLSAQYGKYIERPINKEYGTYVEPYQRQLGDRFSASGMLGFSFMLPTFYSLSLYASYAYLIEQPGYDNGEVNEFLGFSKQTFTVSTILMNPGKNNIVKLNHSNSPPVDAFGVKTASTYSWSIEVQHVYH